ncbi:NAD-dependent epimerase/dehydratase family protein [Gammaproteobacteria bacterium]|nr:NAD-dependent epimerase/dehydratase family protein [Gammaproteobacteria bacterium]
MKKVIILGGAGFIGLNIARYLIKNRNYEITIADNLSRGKMDSYMEEILSEQNVNFIEGDFTKESAFDNLEKDYDYCYMLASVVGVNNTLKIPGEIIRINTSLILNTLEWLRKGSAKNVVFTSTSENYAGTIDRFGYDIPTPEDIPLSIVDISHPRYTYAVTKILGESGFLNYSKSYNFNCTIVRYHNVIGPRMGFKHVIPHLAERFLMNKENPFLMYGHDQTRAFCDIQDAVEGTVLAIESDKSNGEIFHIGSDKEISIEKLIKSSGEFFNYKGDYKEAQTYPGSTNRRCPDISKANELLGFVPKVQWEDSLKETLAWYQDFFEKGEIAFEKSFEKPENV